MAQHASTHKYPCIRTTTLIALVAAAMSWPGTAEAGFAVLGSFAVLFVTMILAGVSLLAWPFRMLWRMIRRRKRRSSG